MQWFIALNDAGPAFAQYADMAKVAVHTAQTATSLQPHVIYDGGDNEFTAWLKRRGVPILPWRSSLFDELTAIGSSLPNTGFAGALPGIFLRVDLPVIAERLGLDDYVLYTDSDVMFLRDVAEQLEPVRCRYFAAAPESDRATTDDMNSGVMWMHLPEMRKRQEEFWAFIRSKREELPTYWDQGTYVRFYRSAEGKPLWEMLPPELNWKPYWEPNPEARIVHFHGPKPFQRNYIQSHYPEIEHLSGGCYLEMCDRWEAFLAEANKS